MPEGDSVFKLARYLAPQLLGREVVDGYVRNGHRIDLCGRRVDDVYARGKHLFIGFGERMLRSHLGMWGTWHAYAPGEGWRKPRAQAAIVIDIGVRVFACFYPQQVEWMHRRGVRRRRVDIGLGPDLLGETIDYAVVIARARTLAEASAPLADVLLDQRIATGIGNVFKSETLFLEHLDPNTRLGDVDDACLGRLYRRAARLMRANTHGGPRVTRPTAGRRGRLWVYGRAKQPCFICDRAIVARPLGHQCRITFWCPNCQPG